VRGRELAEVLRLRVERGSQKSSNLTAGAAHKDRFRHEEAPPRIEIVKRLHFKVA
jgi:hypothetical protein